MGLKTEIIPKKDQRRRKREIVRGKTTKIPPSEKNFSHQQTNRLYLEIFSSMSMSMNYEGNVRTSGRQDWHDKKITFENFYAFSHSSLLEFAL